MYFNDYEINQITQSKIKRMYNLQSRKSIESEFIICGKYLHFNLQGCFNIQYSSLHSCYFMVLHVQISAFIVYTLSFIVLHVQISAFIVYNLSFIVLHVQISAFIVNTLSFIVLHVKISAFIVHNLSFILHSAYLILHSSSSFIFRPLSYRINL